MSAAAQGGGEEGPIMQEQAASSRPSRSSSERSSSSAHHIDMEVKEGKPASLLSPSRLGYLLILHPRLALLAHRVGSRIVFVSARAAELISD